MSKKILLADDSITIQKVVSLTLASEDYELIIVGDGGSALKKAREVRPDLVIADLSMPGMNGYELCEAIKRDAELAGTPVMLLASTFEPIDEKRAESVGADGHIVKPFESEELITKIKELLSRPPKAVAEALEQEATAEPLTEEKPLVEEEPPSFTPEEPQPVAEPGPGEAVSFKEEEREEELTLSEDIWEPEDFIESAEEKPAEEGTQEGPGEQKEEFFDLKLSEDEMETGEKPAEEGITGFEEPAGTEPIKEEEEEITELTTPVVEEEGLAEAVTEEVPAEEERMPAGEESSPEAFEGLTAQQTPVEEEPAVPSEPVKEGLKEEFTEEELSKVVPQEKVEQIVREVARKVIEEVAWDVVPELAEEYIKKEIIDKLKDAISKLK